MTPPYKQCNSSRPKNWLGLVGFSPHNKQTVVPYKWGLTVSLLSSYVLVEYICHVYTYMQAHMQQRCIIRSFFLNSKNNVQLKHIKKELSEKCRYKYWGFPPLQSGTSVKYAKNTDFWKNYRPKACGGLNYV